MNVMMYSRRTIMDGEVVTFATGFKTTGEGILRHRDAGGPFKVSASRNAVAVHWARCQRPEDIDALQAAIGHARKAMERLAQGRTGGMPSLYPDEPTECPQEEATR